MGYWRRGTHRELNWPDFLSVSPGVRFSVLIESIADESQSLNLKVAPLAILSLDGVYRVTLLLFLLMLAREVHRPGIFLALGLIVFLLSVPHLLVEVRPRYHMAMTPFIVVGSMLLAYDLWDRRREWYDSVLRQKERWLGNRANSRPTPFVVSLPRTGYGGERNPFWTLS